MAANNIRVKADIRRAELPPGMRWKCAAGTMCDGEIEFPPTEPKHTPFLVDEKYYCVECIQGQFQLAVDYEESWPTNILNKTLDIDDFVGLMEPDFIALFHKKERVYNSGGKENRIFCPHVREAAGGRPAEPYDMNGHWRQRPGCPRYWSIDPRRGDRIAKWDWHEYEVQDVARRLFDRKEVDNFDQNNRHGAAIATTYPPNRAQELPTIMSFEALVDRPSPIGSLARRVVDTHDRLLVGDMAVLWSKDRPSDPGVFCFREGKEFVQLLAHLRRIVTYMHNEDDVTWAPPPPRSDDAVLKRVRFTHYVRLFTVAVRDYDRLDLRIQEFPELRLGRIPGWMGMLRTLHQMRYAYNDSAGNDDSSAALRQAIMHFGQIINTLAPRFVIDDTDEDNSGLAGIPILVEAFSILLVVGSVLRERGFRRGNLSIPDSNDVLKSLPRLAVVANEIARLDTVGMGVAAVQDLATLQELITTLPSLFTELTDGEERRGEVEHWTTIYSWVQDVLLTVTEERLSRAASGGNDLPRMEELQHVLGVLEPLLAHFTTPPVIYTGLPVEVLNAALQLRDDTRYDAGEGPLQPVFTQAYEHLQNILVLYGRAAPDDRDCSPARTFSEENDEDAFEAMTKQLNSMRALRDACRARRRQTAHAVERSLLKNMMQLHAAMDHLLKRLLKPGTILPANDMVMLRMVREGRIRHVQGWGMFASMSFWTRQDQQFFHLMKVVLEAADRSPEINTEAKTARMLFTSRLKAAERLLQDSSDRAYLEGIFFAWDRDREVWDPEDLRVVHPDRDEIDLARYHGLLFKWMGVRLLQFCVLRSLPPGMRDQTSSGAEKKLYWDVCRGYLALVRAGEIMDCVPRFCGILAGLSLEYEEVGETGPEFMQRMSDEMGIETDTLPRVWELSSGVR
ncbi:hypothetical protein LTR08_000352 [Meristemomyces frigidus]|nr:hypothetical protein LTR08_000352 [Meristemomyces frigidus]